MWEHCLSVASFADTFENRRRNKMGKIDVFTVAVCCVYHLQMKGYIVQFDKGSINIGF